MKTKSASRNLRMALAEDTIGPYYPYGFLDADRDDLTILHHGLAVRPAGQRIVLQGRILDSAGMPVEDALLEFWQANAAGLLQTPHRERDP